MMTSVNANSIPITLPRQNRIQRLKGCGLETEAEAQSRQ